MMSMNGKRIEEQVQFDHETMSILTTASGEASVSESGQQSSSFASLTSIPAKKKRNMQEFPEPETEVIALSPNTLMTSNRFVCEVCNKGFKRDQNLQLHRRGHNLPWKLKQRITTEAKKKVYICPETTCVNHDPSRALGDLTGIKKHFSRKHGEKKWNCQKCSKKYAVQSDWKAHSKICGTREYRCDCGTIFSRRDSFATHRAFCDALAQERARAIAMNNINAMFSQHGVPVHPQRSTLQQDFMQSQFPHFSTTTQTEANNQSLTSSADHYQLQGAMPQSSGARSVANLNASAHMSATALLQKAAHMSVTVSGMPSYIAQMTSRPANAAVGDGSGLSLEQEIENGVIIDNNSLPSTAGFDLSFEEAFGGIIGHASDGGDNVETTRDFLGFREHFSRLE